MSNKSNFSTILGFVAATVIAGGGSAFVTETGLQMYEKQNAITHESEQVAVVARETELPITVKSFSATKDSFTVKPVPETENTKKDSDKKDTEVKQGSTKETESDRTTDTAEGGKSESTEAETEKATEAKNNGSADPAIIIEGQKSDNSKPSSEKELPKGSEPVEYDEWGGWMAANGNYFDGQGGYWDGDGYHYVGDSIKTPSGAADYKPSGSSGSSDTGSSSGYDYSYGWDDSYILYDTAVRYLSKGELSDWGPWELAAARNEIFARHGRIFYTDEWSSYFAAKSWYTPRYDNVDNLLNDYEWKNLDLIMKLEEKYY